MEHRERWFGNTPEGSRVVPLDANGGFEPSPQINQEDPTTTTLLAPATTSHAAPVTPPPVAAPVR